MKFYKKAILGMPFDWMFAIIVGAFILFLAIYFTVNFIQTSEIRQNTETAAIIKSYLDPFETGLASGKSSNVSFRKETRTIMSCNALRNPPFGEQTIRFSDKNLKESFGNEGEAVPIKDKYIFSEEIIQGKNWYVFSIPFFMPFKVSDIIIISSENYCFYNTPEEIEEEIKRLQLININMTNDKKCAGVSVCFYPTSQESNCSIKVNTNSKTVDKDNKKVYYEGNLVYGAIFSSPEIYECNVKRLMNKAAELSMVYNDKIILLERVGCGSTIKGDLTNLINNIKNFDSSAKLKSISALSENIDEQNEAVKPDCKVY